MDSSAHAEVPFTKRLAPLPPVVIPWIVIVTGILTILTGLITNRQIRDYPEGAPLHHDLTRPVLALELPHDARDVRITVAPPDPPVSASVSKSIPDMFRRSLYCDFTFIAAYSSFFALSLAMLPWSRRFWMLALFAGALDVVENVLLLQMLGATGSVTDTAAANVRTVSLGKWAFIALITLLIGWALTEVELRPFRRPGTGLLAITMLIAGLVGITGVLPEFPWPPGFFTNRHIEPMTILSGIYPLVVVVGGLYWKFIAAPDTGPQERSGGVLARA